MQKSFSMNVSSSGQAPHHVESTPTKLADLCPSSGIGKGISLLSRSATSYKTPVKPRSTRVIMNDPPSSEASSTNQGSQEVHEDSRIGKLETKIKELNSHIATILKRPMQV